jgi:hypothetical protein
MFQTRVQELPKIYHASRLLLIWALKTIRISAIINLEEIRISLREIINETMISVNAAIRDVMTAKIRGDTE